MFCEFGATMFRPSHESKNRLTHLSFPETVLSIPQYNLLIGKFNERGYPQIRISVDVWRKELYFKISCICEGEQEQKENIDLVVSGQETFLNKSLWDYFEPDDKERLRLMGFCPDMNLKQWVRKISRSKESFVNKSQYKKSSVTTKEFPLNFNKRGVVGCLNSFFYMPGYMVPILLENCFSESQGFYEIGSAHIHPIQEPVGFSEKIAQKIGARNLNMTVSPNDVRYCRSSISANNKLLARYHGVTKDTGETFMSIVGVDSLGQVTDIRHYDFGMIDNIEEMEGLNDRTIETLKSNDPDIGLVVDHFQFFNDSRVSSDRLGGDIGQHIGDPDG